MLSAIANLRLIAKCCRDGQRLEGEVARWLGQGLETFLAHRTSSLHEALGLRVPKGGVPWWREEAIRRRDAALRELASCYFGGLSASAKAREVERLARRYAASAWRFDRNREEMPADYAGKAQQWVWLAFKSGAPMPLGQRQLRQILGR
jgi:hypothetical protein